MDRETSIETPVPWGIVVCDVLNVNRNPFGERTEDVTFQLDGAVDSVVVVGVEVVVVCDMYEATPIPTARTMMTATKTIIVVPIALLRGVI